MQHRSRLACKVPVHRERLALLRDFACHRVMEKALRQLEGMTDARTPLTNLVRGNQNQFHLVTGPWMRHQVVEGGTLHGTDSRLRQRHGNPQHVIAGAIRSADLAGDGLEAVVVAGCNIEAQPCPQCLGGLRRESDLGRIVSDQRDRPPVQQITGLEDREPRAAVEHVGDLPIFSSGIGEVERHVIDRQHRYPGAASDLHHQFTADGNRHRVIPCALLEPDGSDVGIGRRRDPECRLAGSTGASAHGVSRLQQGGEVGPGL